MQFGLISSIHIDSLFWIALWCWALTNDELLHGPARVIICDGLCLNLLLNIIMVIQEKLDHATIVISFVLLPFVEYVYRSEKLFLF